WRGESWGVGRWCSAPGCVSDGYVVGVGSGEGEGVGKGECSGEWEGEDVILEGEVEGSVISIICVVETGASAYLGISE
ncbi:hypothetical protein Tco_0229652, partial [Tanacetum coccineum]